MFVLKEPCSKNAFIFIFKVSKLLRTESNILDIIFIAFVESKAHTPTMKIRGTYNI